MTTRRRPRAALLHFVLIGLWLGAAAAGASPGTSGLFAARLDADNVARLRVGGPDAIGGIGDWAIGNGTLCATISDPAHESVLSVRGGVLVDLGHCGRDDDQWGVLQSMLNLGRDNALPVEALRPEVAGEEAALIATGRVQGVRFETRYALSTARPTRLVITTTLEREEPGERIFLFGDVALHGNRSLTPLTLSTVDPTLSVGFAHPPVDVDDPIAMARALVRADVQVLVGGGALPHGIAYGWQLAEATRNAPGEPPVGLATLGLNGEHFSILAGYTDALVFGGEGEPGLLELAQTVLMDIEPGVPVRYVRTIHVGDRADAASVTDALWADGPLVRGRLARTDTWIHVESGAGGALTYLAPDPDGGFAFRLPPGSAGPHRLRVVDAAGGTAVHDFALAGAVTDLGALPGADTRARLDLPKGETMRLVFVGLDGTPTPRLGWDGIDFTVGAVRFPAGTESNAVSLAGVPSDPTAVRLAPGRYRILATRGPEFSVGEARIELAPGERAALEIAAPRRVLEDAGRISADLHVHSAASDDSAYPIDRQLRAFAAQGGEVLVATEHDRVWDHGPALARLGLADRMASLVGVEVTSTVRSAAAPYTIGHANAFPLRLEPDRYRGGAPDGEGVRLRDVAAQVHGRGPLALLQLNHPRASGTDSGNGSYFSHLGVAGAPLDPTRPLGEGANRVLLERDPGTGARDLDFDAVELLNGASMRAYRRTRADWFALLLQGEYRVGTANSDSHQADEVVALPRNHVVYSGATGTHFDAAAFMTALRAGRTVGSTGPLLGVELGGAGPGGIATGPEGTLHVDVRVADWVPVRSVRVYVDGARRSEHAIEGSASLALPLRFERDAFVTVEVEGDAGADATGRYALIAPGFVPFAFSNPIFVDADGDGRWTPPGLPEALPDTLTRPVEAP